MRFTGLSEFLWLILLMGVFIFYNVLAQRRSRRAQEERLRQAARQAQLPTEPPVPDTSWGRLPTTEPAAPPPRDDAWGRALSLEELAAPSPPRRLAETTVAAQARAAELPTRRAPLFRSREDLRRGVVLMTVLGPCRAAEPYGPAPASTRRSQNSRQ